MPLILVGQDTLFIKFFDVKNVYNNHVGNEWRFGTYINDHLLGVEEGINLIYTSDYDKLELKAVLQEGKEKYNDTNVLEFEFDISDLKSTHPHGFYIEIDLTEGHGRYAGNKALWRFYYEIR